MDHSFYFNEWILPGDRKLSGYQFTKLKILSEISKLLGLIFFLHFHHLSPNFSLRLFQLSMLPPSSSSTNVLIFLVCLSCVRISLLSCISRCKTFSKCTHMCACTHKCFGNEYKKLSGNHAFNA